MDSTLLFTNPPTGVGMVISTIFSIFTSYWKPLLLLSVIQILTTVVVTAVLALISYGFLAAYIGPTMTAVLQHTKGYGRHLMDFSAGSRISRLLWGSNPYYGYNDDTVVNEGSYLDYTFNDGTPELFDAKFIAILVTVCIIWILVLSIIGSLFTSAFIHTMAEIYVGNSPGLGKSIAYARTKMWSVSCFLVLYHLAILVLAFLIVGIPILADMPDFKNAGVIVLLGIIFVTLLVTMFSSTMVAAVPSIVIENRSFLGAFSRSWNLCKQSICFIFCTVFSFNCLVIILSILINIVLGFIGPTVVNLIVSVFNPLLNFVLYMSIRVQKENASQEELACEIGKNTIDRVEMSENGEKAIVTKGPYTHAVNVEAV